MGSPELKIKMYPLFKESQRYFKTQNNSWIFTLYSRLTVGILVTSFTLVSTYGYTQPGGSPVQCMADKKIGLPPRTLNTFCWFSSTYTLPRYWTGRPGLAWGVGISSSSDERIYHAYYQWVPYFLVLLVVLFSIPNFLWENNYSQILQSLSNGLEEKEPRVEKIAHYILSGNNQNMTFLRGILWCEALYVIIVGVAIVILNSLLGGNFYKYGIEVLSWQNQDAEYRVDPMSRIFPRITKCDFYRFGPSGTIVNYDALCILGVNVLNEKIFLFLWFWFLLTLTLSVVLLSVRLSCAVSSRARTVTGLFIFPVGLELRAEDWTIVQQLSYSVEQNVFLDLLKEISILLPDKNGKRKHLL